MAAANPLQATGQDDATFLYPAVTDAELANQDLLVTSYRRCMGKSRIYLGLVGFFALGWLADYVIHGPRPSKAR